MRTLECFKKAQDERAQGVIEFALIISVMMLIFLGTVDYARFLYYDTAIRNAARIGAEVASNHCPIASSCGVPVITQDSYVMWSTYCESRPYATLQPKYSSCFDDTPQPCPDTTIACTPPCSSTCTACSQDICVYPAVRTTHSKVTVAVGYSFKPITFLLSPFFNDQSCWQASAGAASDDSTSTNHHTLCAMAVGRVY